MSTLNDVATRAGVSISVVSRVLNADPALRARPETKARVKQAARELAYRPNKAAQALRLSHAGAVGLIVPDVTNAIFAELLRGVEDAADEAGTQVLLGRSERLRPGDDFLGQLLGEGRVDGFIIQRRDEIDLHVLEAILQRKMPVVLVNSRGPSRGSLILDDVAAGRIATEHLIGLGHRDIGLINGDVNSFTAKRRGQGYRLAMAGAGLRKRLAWTTNHGYTPQAGRRSIHELLTSKELRPTAVVVANVNAAVGVLLGARESGVLVPDELSVVAIHDSWVGEFSSPPLTVVEMARYQLGRQGFIALTARLAGAKPYDGMVNDPPPTLIVRASTAPPQ